MHYGLIPILKRYECLSHHVEDFSEIELLETDPRYIQMKNVREKTLQIKILYELALSNKKLNKEMISFFRLQMFLLLKWGNFDLKKSRLLQSPKADILSKLPEHFLSDITHFYLSFFNNEKHPFDSFSHEDAISVIEMAIIVIRSPKAITNPFIVVDFVKVVSRLVHLIKAHS